MRGFIRSGERTPDVDPLHALATAGAGGEGNPVDRHQRDRRRAELLGRRRHRAAALHREREPLRAPPAPAAGDRVRAGHQRHRSDAQVRPSRGDPSPSVRRGLDPARAASLRESSSAPSARGPLDHEPAGDGAASSNGAAQAPAAAPSEAPAVGASTEQRENRAGRDGRQPDNATTRTTGTTVTAPRSVTPRPGRGSTTRTRAPSRAPRGRRRGRRGPGPPPPRPVPRPQARVRGTAGSPGPAWPRSRRSPRTTS